MARQDVWSVVKGTFQITTTGPGTPKRFRLTDHAKPGDSSDDNAWRPWNAVAVDAQHLSGTVYVAFNGTTATSTLATAVYDETRTTFRMRPRTRVRFDQNATSISIVTSSAGTVIYVDVYRL